MSGCYEIEFAEPVALVRFGGRYHPWGTPRFADGPSMAEGRYRFEERPNPATGTPLESGVVSPWLFLEGSTLGASKAWLLSRATRPEASLP